MQEFKDSLFFSFVVLRLLAPARWSEDAVQQVAATGVAVMYEDGYLGRATQIAKPTRTKETFYITQYIVPRWGEFRLNQIQPQAVEDWLHTTFDSWWTMHGVRAIMSRIYHYAEGHGLWEEGKRTPVSRPKLGKKRHKYERRILSLEETARVLERLEPDAHQRKVLPHYVRERVAPLAPPLDRFAHGRAIQQGADRGMDQRLRYR